MIRISISDNEGEIVGGKYQSTIEAITQLQSAIEHLRRKAAPTFDASWGEQPMPLIAPTEAEFRQAQ